jgi:hypothetical protein
VANPEAPDPAEVAGGGAAIVVATVGEDGRPALTRGWGPRYDSEARSLTLAVTAPSGSRTLAHLESTGSIAVTASQPLSYQTVQMKGTVAHVGAPSEQDRAEVRAHLDRFVAEVAELGITEGAERLFAGDLRTVVVEVNAIYDQTPGRNAGSPIS